MFLNPFILPSLLLTPHNNATDFKRPALDRHSPKFSKEHLSATSRILQSLPLISRPGPICALQEENFTPLQLPMLMSLYSLCIIIHILFLLERMDSNCIGQRSCSSFTPLESAKGPSPKD